MLKVYIYDHPDIYQSDIKGFEECTDIEHIFTQTIPIAFNRVYDINEAHFAFFPSHNGSLFTHAMSHEDAMSLWRDVYTPMIAPYIHKVPHITVWGYVFYNIDLLALNIPPEIYIISLEKHPSHPRTITVPYILNHQTHETASKTTPVTSPQHPSNTNKTKLLAYVGRNENPLIAQIIDTFPPESTTCTNAAIDDPFEVYKIAQFSLILDGDTPTRKAFYHSLAANCIPIITNTALEHYDSLFNHTLPLKSFSEIAIIYSNIETLKVQMETFQPNYDTIYNLAQLFNYYTYPSSPVIKAIHSIVFPRIFVTPSTHITPKYPIYISPSEIITQENIYQSQYSLEVQLNNFMIHEYPARTLDPHHADITYLPITPFLAAWTTRPYFYDVEASTQHVLDALTQTSPHSKTIMFAYSDVMWHDQRVFLNHPQVQRALPPKTIIVAYEAHEDLITQAHIYPVPFMIPNPRNILLTYIGRPSRPIIENLTKLNLSPTQFTYKPIQFAEQYWKSSNTIVNECHALYSRSMFSLHPHGDMKTRAGFYQSLQTGCIPVIFESNQAGYRAVLKDTLDTKAIILPDDITPEHLISYLTWVKQCSNVLYNVFK
jgi:hypothetical protein